MLAPEQSAFREGDDGVLRDDHVIEHADVDEREGLLERCRQQLIRS